LLSGTGTDLTDTVVLSARVAATLTALLSLLGENSLYIRIAKLTTTKMKSKLLINFLISNYNLLKVYSTIAPKIIPDIVAIITTRLI
jgi:hypothetical protein